MFTVMALDPYEDMGQKWETFKSRSAAEVYGRSYYGIDNFLVVPGRKEVKDDEYCRTAA